MRLLICLLVWLYAFSCPLSAQDPRKTTSLNGEWKFRRDDQKDGKTVTLPTHWETHEGLKFDGIGWYEKTLPAITLPPGRRLLLHFDAVATHATVYWNDFKLGEHLGAWTPFRFDVTEHVKKPGPHTIRVRVDEKVGHNTQGFLPIIAPHFGGIWQGVKLIEVASSYLDEQTLTLKFDPTTRLFELAAQQCGELVPLGNIEVSWRKRGQEKWQTVSLEYMLQGSIILEQEPNAKQEEWIERFRLKDQHKWPDDKITTEARLHVQRRLPEGWKPKTLTISVSMPHLDTWSPGSAGLYEIRIAIRENVNSTCIESIQTTFALRAIETKGDQFLLNGRPLSIRGVLNWGYYPPSLAPTPTEEQWRSDLRLIKSWGFNLMKCCLWVPPKRLLDIADEEGVLIWLEYPTWHPKLTPQYRDELMREYREFHQHDRNHPSVILRSLTCETGPGADLQVIRDLYDQCKKMCGGLVVDDSSWIEWNRVCDFYDDHPYGNNHTWVPTLTRLKNYIAKSKLGVKPLCLGEAIAADTWVPTQPMLDAIAKAKADPKQAWSLDDRGYPFWVPGFFDANRRWLDRMAKVCGGPIDEKQLEVDSLKYAWLMRKYQIEAYRKEVPNGGYVVSVIRDFPLASMGLFDYLGAPKWKKEEWRWHGGTSVTIDPWASDLGWRHVGWPAWPTLFDFVDWFFNPERYPVVKQTEFYQLDWPGNFKVTRRLTPEDLDFLEKGGRMFLHPDGQPNSFPLADHWFLRGAPLVNPHHSLITKHPGLHQFLVENQHFNYAGKVIPDVRYLEEIDPLMMLWDNHDIKEVRTHGLVFETKVGKGRLMVSCLDLGKGRGAFLQRLLFNHLWRSEGKAALKPETITRLRAKLNEKKLDLTKPSWQFQPDGKNEGLNLGWHKPDFDDRGWKPIKIGQHWEGQGYPTLDGWAWYRLKIDVPRDWPAQGFYLNTEGVDDAYELYVNGTKIGAGGDIPNKQTAFEERKSHPLPAGLLKPGEPIVIAVRVYDWYGAGGVHRPMTLTNIPFGGSHLLR